jgi:hypothetical protein
MAVIASSGDGGDGSAGAESSERAACAVRGGQFVLFVLWCR